MKRWYFLVKVILHSLPILLGDLKVALGAYYQFCKDLREIWEEEDLL